MAASKVKLSYKPRLLYCPLCGGTPKLMQRNTTQGKSSRNYVFWIVCENCKAETRPQPTLPKLLSLWNKREVERCQTVFI